MNINRKEVFEIALKHCKFEGEGTYYPRVFPTEGALFAFIEECVDLDRLVALAKPESTTPAAEQAKRPEFIQSALGDMVFDGDEGYEELLESSRESAPPPAAAQLPVQDEPPTFTPWNSLPWKPKPIGFARRTDIELYAKVLTIRPVDAEHDVALFTRDQLQRAVSAALLSMDGLQEVTLADQLPTRAEMIAIAKDCAANDPERHDYTRTARADMWMPHDWVIKAMERVALPVQAPVQRLTDEQIDDIQEAAYKALVAKGYNGGMGGLTWDRASARAIEAALAVPQQVEQASEAKGTSTS